MRLYVPLTITLLAAVVVVALAGKEEGESISVKGEQQPIKFGLYQACERIMFRDPTVKKSGIDTLFEEGFVGYRILHLEWIAESDPEFRDYILQGFSKMGDHKHIASNFPQDWIDASNRFSEPERSARLAELKKYFGDYKYGNSDGTPVVWDESEEPAD
jgi:hypothetical protein